MTDFKSLFTGSKFRFLWTSQLFSQLTIQIMNFLILIRLFNATESTIATSLLWVSYALPAIFIGPFAAASVDMFDRRKMLMMANLLQALVIFGFSFVHSVNLFLLYGIVVIYSFLNQFYIPAEAASLPGLVKQKDLPQANGLFFLTQQVAIVVGFGMAGFLNQTLGFDNSLLLCSAFLLIAFISVSFLPEIKASEKIPPSLEKTFFTFFTRIFEGYNFIRKNNYVLLPFVLLVGFQVGLAIVIVNAPLIARDLFKIDVNLSGALLAVPAGVGAIIASLGIPLLLRRELRKKQIIELSIMLMLASIFVITFIIPDLSFTAALTLGVFAVIIIGACFVGVIIPALTFLQTVTPGGMRGRVFGNFGFLITIATIFPVIFSGAIADVFGVRLLLLLIGSLTLGSLIFSKKWGQKMLEKQLKIALN